VSELANFPARRQKRRDYGAKVVALALVCRS
jgi:hypothetical protein